MSVDALFALSTLVCLDCVLLLSESESDSGVDLVFEVVLEFDADSDVSLDVSVSFLTGDPFPGSGSISPCPSASSSSSSEFTNSELLYLACCFSTVTAGGLGFLGERSSTVGS